MRPRSSSRARPAVWLLVSLATTAYAGAAPDPRCEWPHETASRLDLGNRTDQRHLNHDALVAEELAIRFADVRRGHRSGQYKGSDEYRETRDQCLASLSRVIAANHGLGPVHVFDAVGQRDDRLDAAVLVTCAALYAVVVSGLARRLFLRFLPDEPWPALIGTAVSALLVSAAGVMIGSVVASVVEMIRVGDTHLSYRAFRIPWNEHWLLFYFGALALFFLVAGARLGASRRGRKLAE